MNFIHDREQLLDRVFKNSFKLCNSSAMISTAVQDLFSSLIDGYQKTLTAFSKFCNRQWQQLQYKIERLTKVNQDLHSDLHKKYNHDKFLKKKLENFMEDIKRIENKIDQLNDTSILEEKRQKIKDSYSNVTALLDKIVRDLAKQRLPIRSQYDFEDSLVSSEDDGETNNSNVKKLDVIPFQTFKEQIDQNYSEIQTKTKQAIIRSLAER